MSRSEKQDIDVGVQRCTAVLFPARRHISGKAPHKLIVRTMFGLLRIDLAQATHSGWLLVDITCVLGRVELTCRRTGRFKPDGMQGLPGA